MSRTFEEEFAEHGRLIYTNPENRSFEEKVNWINDNSGNSERSEMI